MAPLKPEYALSKAKELINVKKPLAAIEVLSECMKVQKKMWVKAHEEVMLLLAELCVDNKRSLPFKETVHAYKNMTFQMNPKSVEDVVKCYLSSARKRTEEAREKTQELGTDVDDLDNPETPENLILNAVKIEDEQERQDRALLTPWLKFLWESYRLCLDLLRGNVKFEKLYHDTALEAYEFCQNFDRKNEFRKLCDILRQHMIKYQGQQLTNLPTSETWAYHLELRLKQLDYALKFELFNESFKIVEDIRQLLANPSVNAKPRIYANYYQKTAQVLFESGVSRLFHAAALQRLFFYSKDNKRNMSDTEMELLASRMVVATLAVPLSVNRDVTDSSLESGEITNPIKQKALSQLLHLPNLPTRAQLIQDIIDNRIVDCVNTELANLFNVLECEFRPLSMAHNAVSTIDWMAQHSELSVYIDQIRDVITSKTLIQIGKVYKTMKFNEFAKLCAFHDTDKLHSMLISLIRNLELPIHYDYQTQMIIFDVDTNHIMSQKNDSHVTSDGINTNGILTKCLMMFSKAVFDVTNFVGYVDTSKRDEREEWRHLYLRRANELHQQMAERKNIIENKKEEIEFEKEESEQKARNEKTKIYERHVREEARRLKTENEETEQKKIKEDLAREIKKITKAKINYLMGSEAGNQVLKNLSEKEVEEMDERSLALLQSEEKNKIKDVQEQRLKKLLQKTDFFQRAMRVEEIPLVKNIQKENYVKAQKMYEEKERLWIEEAERMHADKLRNKAQCLLFEDDISKHLRNINIVAEEKYKRELEIWESDCEKIRAAYRERQLAELMAEKIKEDELLAARIEEETALKGQAYVPPHKQPRATVTEPDVLPIQNRENVATGGKYVPPHKKASVSSTAKPQSDGCWGKKQ